MKTVGEFITESAARLAPFDRARVGRVGCGFSLAAMAVAIVLIAAGTWDTAGSWAAGFRFVVLSGIGTVLLVFAGIALAETIVERSVRASVAEFLKQGGSDAETLLKAAEMRQGQVKGGTRFVALLRERLSGR